MGLFDKILGGKNEQSDVPDLEDLMQAEGDVVSPPADFYVKKVELRNEGDGDLVLKELGQKNIVILDVNPLKNQPNRLKTILSKLRSYSGKINGDVAALANDTKTALILLTPANVKIVKSKPKAKPGSTVIS
ncbi:Cell division protein SepF [Candidatus Bilamarchaeum dharawalense]|uniref:Cell division protein SepF n=1 Tax=Candidatus Bilamarchaeum dharawalense TaxID=2885759 RepID=A0A5E4LPM0_9ARCH|nr:Cell division protein SepF [Candidatus Bilamarchaeum dharawalense]